MAGAALNTRPDLFQAAVLTVPSLDALGPMLADQDSLDELGDACGNAACYQVLSLAQPRILQSPFDGARPPNDGRPSSHTRCLSARHDCLWVLSRCGLCASTAWRKKSCLLSTALDLKTPLVLFVDVHGGVCTLSMPGSHLNSVSFPALSMSCATCRQSRPGPQPATSRLQSS